MDWLKELIEKATTEGSLNIDELMKSINAEFPKHAVPKVDFNALNDTKKELEGQIKDRDKQLKDLGEKVKDNEELSKQIKELQDTNATAKATYESKIEDMIIDSAIKAKLTDTKYPELLTGKFDRTKIVVAADGTVSGIDEQLTSIKDTYKDLFTPVVSGKQPNNTGGNQPPKGKRQELEAIINDPNTKFVDRVAAKNQLFKLEREE